MPADAISVPADSAAAVVKFTISIPRESCTNAKAKYSSSIVPPDPSVHFYHWLLQNPVTASRSSRHQSKTDPSSLPILVPVLSSDHLLFLLSQNHYPACSTWTSLDEREKNFVIGLSLLH